MIQKPRLTRPEAAAFLTENGYPVAKSTLMKMASVGGGPAYQVFGSRVLYDPAVLLAWAEGKLSAPRRSTSDEAA